MLRSLAVPSLAVLAAVLTTDAHALAKPCGSPVASPDLEEMLVRAHVALDLAGTDRVALDPTRRCIGIQVRTRGTARLVKLLLRGVEVPGEAVDIQVVPPAAARGA